MSKVICVAGESGSGKTTAMRNLPPAETYYIDCDKKGLSWKGWRQQYNAENKNYKSTNDIAVVMGLLDGISEKCPGIKYVVIDTVNGIMIADEMRRAKEKGYDKWTDLAQCIWDMADGLYSYRDDLMIIVMAHTQTDENNFTRIKTNGKKIDKIALESKFTTVLLAKCVGGQYVFETHSQNSTTKTPLGAFEADTIGNDIVEVIKALDEY